MEKSPKAKVRELNILLGYIVFWVVWLVPAPEQVPLRPDWALKVRLQYEVRRLCESPGRVHNGNHGKASILVSWIWYHLNVLTIVLEEICVTEYLWPGSVQFLFFIWFFHFSFPLFDYSFSTFTSGASRQMGVYPENLTFLYSSVPDMPRRFWFRFGSSKVVTSVERGRKLGI